MDGIVSHLDAHVEWDQETAREAAQLGLQCREKVDRPDLNGTVLPTLQRLVEAADKAEAEAAARRAEEEAAAKAEEEARLKAEAEAAQQAPARRGIFAYVWGKK